MSFSRAFFPVAIMVLIALIAVIISLGMTNRAIKSSNQKLSLHSMDLHFNNIQDFQETMVLDYSEWGDTFTKLTMNNDIEWFSYSIGGANLINNRIHGIAYIKNDGTLSQQHTRNDDVSFHISQAIFHEDFESIKKETLAFKTLVPHTVSYFKMINNAPTLISFSPITHPNPAAYPDFNLDNRDFLVFWTVVTPALLARTSERLNLQNLTITSQSSPYNFAFKDNQDNIISQLSWALKKDATNPLALSFYTSIAMFSLLVIGGLLSFIRLTELIRQLNEAKSSAERGHKIKSEFLATMSHELRTPLNSIIGFSDILQSTQKDSLTESQSEYIGHIQASGKHLLNIINEILDMSKIEAGKYDLAEEEMDIRRVINQSIIYLEKPITDKNITLIKKIPEKLNEFMGDSKVIKQLLLNLLSNSIKFTPEGGQVTVSCSITPEGCMELYVEDTGVGISPEKLDIITEPYLQDQDHKTRTHEGTGLGLAITKAFVEMHQGILEITSELNVGTRVTITFPASRVLPDLI